MSQKQKQNPQGKSRSRLTINHIILILGVLIILTAGAVTALVLTRPQQTEPTNVLPIAENAGAPVINAENMEQIMGEVSEKVERGMFHTHYNTTWRFPDGETKSENAVMGNAAENNYPMWFEVIINDTSEVIYTSSLLPVGSEVKEIVLARDLAQGTYNATIQVHMVDENGEPVESNMGFAITLNVQG